MEEEKIISYVVCEKCGKRSTNIPFELNFLTKQINYLCPLCNHNNKILLFKEAQPLPRTIVTRF